MVPSHASQSLEFDPHDPSITADNLHARYDELRARCPVSHGSKYGGYWVLTRYDDVRAVALDANTFSSASGVYLPAISEKRLPLLEMDDPEHRIYRRVLSRQFNTVVAKSWAPRIAEIVTDLIDGFVADGRADLITQFAEPLPLTVIGEIFGLSREDREQVRKDAFDFLACASGSPDAAQALDRMLSRWEGLVAERRQNPADDLITTLVQADYGQWDGSDELIARIMFTLTFGGHDTTILVLGNMLLHLARHPEQRRSLIDDPELIPAAVEELLRLYAPLHNFRRDATVDTAIGGTPIKAGDPVLLGWGAANRDPEKFPNPSEADFSRPNARDHLTFGAGTPCVHRPVHRASRTPDRAGRAPEAHRGVRTGRRAHCHRSDRRRAPPGCGTPAGPLHRLIYAGWLPQDGYSAGAGRLSRVERRPARPGCS